MSEAKHTPGHTPEPWINKGNEGAGAVSIVGDAQQLVCLVYGATPEERDTNAHLITAAPELLEALKLARDTVYNAVRSSLSQDLYDSKEEYRAALLNHSTIKRCDNALAKAAGRA